MRVSGAVRGADGQIRSWPLTQNVHSDGILALSLPGVFDSALQAQAEEKMRLLMDELDYTGVLTIEFFLRDGELLANEFAPRVHNSGHWTIDGSPCSQFEAHVRAIAGMPQGETCMSAHSLMFNWIGRMPERDRVMSVPGVHWHDYGKEPRPGRKIGHATLTAATADELRKNASKVANIAGEDFPRLFENLLFQD